MNKTPRIRPGSGSLLAPIGGVALLLLFAIAGTWFVARRGVSADQAAARAQPPPSVPIMVTPTLMEIKDMISGRCIVTPGQETPIALKAPEGREPVVSKLPIAAGGAVSEGDVIAEIAGRPLFVLGGAVPMYRDLSVNDTGDDVTSLQQALRRIGLNIDNRETGKFDGSTAAAVAKLYSRVGYVHSVRAGQPAESSTAEGAAPAAPAPAVTAVPRTEIAFVPNLPATVSRLDIGVGQPAKAEQPSIYLSTGAPSAEAEISPTDISRVVPGLPVDIQGDVGWKRTGLVAHTGQRGPSAEVADQPSIQIATIAVSEPLSATDIGSGCEANFVLAKSDGKVLALPLGAIQERPDGSTFVKSKGQEIDIKVGVSGGGFVAVTASNPKDLDTRSQVVVG